MGEFHPAEKKVVVQFCPADLQLTKVQEDKLRKIAGTRYNPETDIIKMSCESFNHQAQNKRYLGNLVIKMIEVAKVSARTSLEFQQSLIVEVES
jgi:small subunit ribosomal protein S35